MSWRPPSSTVVSRSLPSTCPTCARSASGSGWGRGRSTSPRAWPGRRTSSNTCSSRAPSSAAPVRSPNWSTPWAGTSTPLRPRSTRPFTCGSWPNRSTSASTSSRRSSGPRRCAPKNSRPNARSSWKRYSCTPTSRPKRCTTCSMRPCTRATRWAGTSWAWRARCAPPPATRSPGSTAGITGPPTSWSRRPG